MEILTGFVIGFFGSLHCIGMCGPIVLALPSASVSIWSLINRRLVYNLGRVFTYSVLGLIFGLLGGKIYTFGLQQIVSISLGAIIILWFVLPAEIKNKIRSNSGFTSFAIKLKNLFIPLFERESASSMFLIGVLNGFLPCGFVYMGLAGAIALSGAGYLNGMLFMTFFGLGTVPAMLGMSMAGNYISLNIRRKFAKLVPVFAVILAVIFVLRGMNLGIPYVSPKLDMKKQVSADECIHH